MRELARTWTLVAVAAALAACGDEAPDPKTMPSEPPAEKAPAPAPAATKPEPAPAPPAPPVTPGEQPTLRPAADAWASHKGDVKFVVGARAGLEKARQEGKPVFLFYTQHH